jgi:hypothetical protein
VREFLPPGEDLVVLLLRGFDLLAELQPGDDAAVALDGVLGEVGEQSDSQDGTDDVTRAAPDFADEVHGRSESQRAPRSQQKKCN